MKISAQESLRQACSTLHTVQETSTKFQLHAGNMKFNTHYEEGIRRRIVLPAYFSMYHVQQKYRLLLIKGTIYKMHSS
jgi:uncharacterized protein (UPF0332 family)